MNTRPGPTGGLVSRCRVACVTSTSISRCDPDKSEPELPSSSLSNQSTGARTGPLNAIWNRCVCSSLKDTPNLAHDLDSNNKPIFYATFMASSHPQRSGFLPLDYPGDSSEA